MRPAPSYAFAEPLGLRVTRYNFTPKRWPDGLKLRIAALADLHASEPYMGVDRIHSIVDQTNALGADVIVLLGDYICRRSVWREPVPPKDWAGALAQLRAPLGVHAILGNHEFWDDRAFLQAGGGVVPFAKRALEDVGIPIYENEVVQLRKDGKPFWLAGLGDQLAHMMIPRRLRQGRRVGVDDLAGTLAKVTDDAPVILLAHEPDIAVRRAGAGVAHAQRTYPWRPGAPVRLVAAGAVGFRQPFCLRPCPGKMRHHHLRRARLQHRAGADRRAAGNRAGDAGRNQRRLRQPCRETARLNFSRATATNNPGHVTGRIVS